MKFIGLVLNLPWSALGLIGVLLSGPRGLTFSRKPPACLFRVASFWWLKRLPGQKGVRAATWGNIIAMGPKSLKNDDKHELIHVEQAMRRPFIHPILYVVASLKYGAKDNPYELEAYTRAGNKYLG